ncbi:MAG: T9SS type A sorting domain-containing protein [Paludibacter sp.]
MKFITKLLFSLFTLVAFNLSAQSYETEFQTRSQQIINYVADDYKADASGWYNCNPSDYGKYNWQIAVASFHKYGVNNAKGNQYLPHFNNSTCIQARFHFNLAGETFLFSNYWGAPSVKSTVKNYLTAAWDRNDSYNLFTAEGTENHIAMTRPAAYLYAQIARDSFPADFPDAQQKLDSAKLWITDWAKKLYTAGLGEWNSSTYAPYGMLGWLGLYDGAKDPDVRKVARAVLDYYACEMALHYTQGIVGGYESRNSGGYESVVTGSDYFSWLWFGESPRKISWAIGSQNVEASTAVYAAVSSYRPPQAAVKLAKKQLAKNAMYYNSKGEYLMNNPGAVKQTFYIGDTYTLGAAYLPYGGFTGGDSQFQAWKFVGKVTPDPTNSAKTANVIVGYGSKEWNKARHRMPWDQLVHHKNVMVQLTKVPSNYTAIYAQIQTIINNWQTSWATDFNKRFPSDGKGNPVNMSADVSNANFSYMAVWKKNATVTRLLRNNIEFFEMDSNYVAIRSIAQTAPTYATATDNYALKDAASQGNLCGLILEVGSKKEYATFLAFQDAIIANSSLNKTNIATDNIIYISAKGDVLNIQYNSSGTFTEPLYDWGYGPTTPQLAQKSPPFIQPTWPTGEGCGRIASWSVNGTAVDFSNSKWSVYDGPNLQLKNSVLRLNDGLSQTFEIDYTGALPVYNSGGFASIAKNNENEDSFKIYPNPTTNLLNIELNSSYIGSYLVELFDLSGKSVLMLSNRKTSRTELIQLPLSKKLKGLFLLKVKTNNNTITKKVQIY